MIRRALSRIARVAVWILDTVVARIPTNIHPDHITHARWVMTLPTVALSILGHPWLAVGALIASSVCDILDGHLARRRELTTEDGAHLDAFADKFFVLVTLWIACRQQVGLPIAIAVTTLEIALSVIRGIKDRHKITGKSKVWGKVKTWAQSFALAFALSQQPFFLPFSTWTFFLAIACAAQSIRGHLRDIRLHKTEKPANLR
jgi:CDP-diacylglycerol--glycerol-3-phosphate 3-phosphatidyltransferase